MILNGYLNYGNGAGFYWMGGNAKLISLNINYFFCFVAIAILWMPVTKNSKLGLIQIDSEEGLDFDHMELEEVDDNEIIEWAERNIPESPREKDIDEETIN